MFYRVLDGIAVVPFFVAVKLLAHLRMGSFPVHMHATITRDDACSQ